MGPPTPPPPPAVPEALIRCLRQARAIVVLTGAGVSAESGIPTFRDALTGLWARYDPEQLATAAAFARDPARVSRWYDERRCRCAQCQPNPGHVALARLETICASRSIAFTLVTQNVDGLHRRAGSRRVLEVHGSLFRWRCVGCGAEREETGPPFEDYPPRCACGGVRRPGVVWFGEMLPEELFEQALQAVRTCELFVSAGTSGTVYPIAGLVGDALASGARVVEINPGPTPVTTRAHWALRGPSGQWLPALVESAFGPASVLK